MSVFDELKGRAGELKDKAAGLVSQNSGRIKDGIGHAGSFVDQKTGGKYTDKIEGVRHKASSMVDRVERDRRGDQDGGPSQTPPAG